jgi:hypothetical protein
MHSKEDKNFSKVLKDIEKYRAADHLPLHLDIMPVWSGSSSVDGPHGEAFD